MRTVLIAVGVVVLASCSCDEDRGRNEAMLFLDRFEDVDVDDPIEERREAIDGIRAMVLTDEDVVRTRDVCVDAHDAMLEAEDQNALGQRLLVEGSAGGDEQVTPEIARQIEAAIEASDAAIERSRELFPRCTREVNMLEGRYHRRRS